MFAELTLKEDCRCESLKKVFPNSLRRLLPYAPTTGEAFRKMRCSLRWAVVSSVNTALVRTLPTSSLPNERKLGYCDPVKNTEAHILLNTARILQVKEDQEEHAAKHIEVVRSLKESSDEERDGFLVISDECKGTHLRFPAYVTRCPHSLSTFARDMRVRAKTQANGYYDVPRFQFVASNSLAESFALVRSPILCEDPQEPLVNESLSRQMFSIYMFLRASEGGSQQDQEGNIEELGRLLASGEPKTHAECLDLESSSDYHLEVSKAWRVGMPYSWDSMHLVVHLDDSYLLCEWRIVRRRVTLGEFLDAVLDKSSVTCFVSFRGEQLSLDDDVQLLSSAVLHVHEDGRPWHG